jgi:hypothetical protein
MVITLRSRAFSPAAALRRSRQTTILRRRGFRAIAAAAAIGLGLTVASSGSATAGSASFLAAAPSVHDQGGNGPAGGGPAINWALAGLATADTSGTNTPASNAIDGDAGTEWCPNQWEGSLTVDLGQVRPLSDVGITMDAAAPAADATIEVASNPNS